MSGGGWDCEEMEVEDCGEVGNSRQWNWKWVCMESDQRWCFQGLLVRF